MFASSVNSWVSVLTILCNKTMTYFELEGLLHDGRCYIACPTQSTALTFHKSFHHWNCKKVSFGPSSVLMEGAVTACVLTVPYISIYYSGPLSAWSVMLYRSLRSKLCNEVETPAKACEHIEWSHQLIVPLVQSSPNEKKHVLQGPYISIYYSGPSCAWAVNVYRSLRSKPKDRVAHGSICAVSGQT